MERCSQQFGTVTIFLPYSDGFGKHELARKSLECYVVGTDYKLLIVDIDRDERVTSKCSNHQAGLFKRHCAVAAYLDTTDWMLVVDAETGVINPQHCVEEWIDNRVNMIFFDRYFNWEISSASYLVRNSKFSRNFLQGLARWEFEPLPSWNSYDQGAFLVHLLQTLYPHAAWEVRSCTEYWYRASSYQTYMATVMCVRESLGARRLWPGKVRIYHKAHGWTRDAWIAHGLWSEPDFMLHAWREDASHDEYPFLKDINMDLCNGSLAAWQWNPKLRLSTSQMKNALAESEEYYRTEFPNKGRIITFLDNPEIAECYPRCEVLQPFSLKHLGANGSTKDKPA